MDYKSKPYSEWLDGQITSLFEYDPKSIAICYITKDDDIGTCYFDADNTDMLRMTDAMIHDRLLNWISINADIISDLLTEGED